MAARPAGHPAGVQIRLVLCLPRDKGSVPMARHVVKAALQDIGVGEDCLYDVEVAVAEACANVLQHAGPGDEYEVHCEVDDQVCVLRIIDKGRGFDLESLASRPDADAAEDGRGISLMQALVDEVRFVSRPETGTLVHLEKLLE